MYGLRGQYSVTVHRGEAFLIVALRIQFTWSWRSTNFVLSSHFLIVFVYLESLCEKCFSDFTSLSSLRPSERYRLERICVQGREQWFIRTGREVISQSRPKKDTWPRQSTFIRLPDFQTHSAFREHVFFFFSVCVLESNQWPWHCRRHQLRWHSMRNEFHF